MWDSAKLLDIAIEEDIPNTDLSSVLCVPSTHKCTVELIAKADGIFCGLEAVKPMFSKGVEPLTIHAQVNDGESFKSGDLLLRIEGNTRRILGLERSALNILQQLSGIATKTHRCVQALAQDRIQVMDTRKTLPGYRDWFRYAVRCGGGHNHRLNLSDMVLIKENHLKVLAETGALAEFSSLLEEYKAAIQKESGSADPRVEVEVDSLQQLKQLDIEQVDILMLDNFSLDNIPKAVQLCKDKGRPDLQIEVSGNITEANIGAYRDLPIHRISLGCLTHSIQVVDMSLLF